ncbi:MAG: hypothetical protein K6T29_04540 [Peptococcaceae bacterium]|nr:hypothetical protein [Peptococcaceae bacterium]
MRRLWVTLIVAALLAGGSAAFAYQQDAGRSLSPGAAAHRQLASSGRERLKDFWGKVQEKAAAIKENRAAARSLQRQLKEQIRQVRGLVGELRKNPAALSPEKVDAVRRALESVEGAHQVLQASGEDIKKYRDELKAARRQRDSEVFLGVLDGITELQEIRISAMKAILAEVSQLSETLK